MRTGLPPSHLVPLSSSVAVKKKKKRRERAALLAGSRNSSAMHGYVSPLKPPVICEQSRSLSPGDTEPAGHSDGLIVETMTHSMQEAQTRPASRGNRSDSWTHKSVNVVCHVGKDLLLLVVLLCKISFCNHSAVRTSPLSCIV